ncbi:MAG TPA: PepSY domain-containing protein [Acidovorax sp.]|nr:PepSY domain-containing protein [Acidovorax sp.]
MKTLALCAAAAAMLLGTSAFADAPSCTAARNDNRLTQAQMLQKLVDAGYSIERFAVTQASCYKMHGWDKDGHRVEIVHHPVDGRIVKLEMSTQRV